MGKSGKPSVQSGQSGQSVQSSVQSIIERRWPRTEHRGPKNPTLPKVNISSMSKDVGVDYRHLLRIISGESQPGIGILTKLAEAFGVQIEDVVGWLDRLNR